MPSSLAERPLPDQDPKLGAPCILPLGEKAHGRHGGWRVAPGCVLCGCSVRGPHCGHRGGASQPEPGGGHIRPPQPPDRKEGWAASASLPPERPFPASESPQGQERGSPTRSPSTSSTSTQENQRRAERESRLVEATGTLQGPSAERGLLQGARGQASHTPACMQHPRFTKVAVRRKQRNGSEMSADRDRGLGVQTQIFPPGESEGRTKVNKKDTDGVRSDD